MSKSIIVETAADLSSNSPETHCGARCRSRRHCLEINAALSHLLLLRPQSLSHSNDGRQTKEVNSADESAMKLVKLCANIGQAADQLGRTPLHLAASAGASSRLLNRLINSHGMDVEARDLENGWTPLHRCVYHGQLEAAVYLIASANASLASVDHDGLTPIDLATLLDVPSLAALPGSPAEACPGYDAYTWGDAANHTLGRLTGHSDCRAELVSSLPDAGVIGVSLGVYHSAFLTADGRVFVCGFGQHRLGLAASAASLAAEPTPLPLPAQLPQSDPVRAVSVGREHTLMLTRSGRLWLAGCDPAASAGVVLGSTGVAGSQQQQQHLPRPVAGWRPEPGRRILGISAARYHSMVVTDSQVFVWGQDRGQFGHPLLKQQQPRLVTRPTPLACVSQMHRHNQPQQQQQQDSSSALWDSAIGVSSGSGGGSVSVLAWASCDSALLVHLERHRQQQQQQRDHCLLLLHSGQVTNLAPKWSGLRIVLLADDPSHFGRSLTACLLTIAGELYLWQPGWQQPLRLRPRPAPLGMITSACLTHRILLIGTDRGRGYRVDLASPTRLAPLSASASANSQLIAPADSIPGLHRAASLFADPRGRTFAALQLSPRHFLTDLPDPPAPLTAAELSDCLAGLLVNGGTAVDLRFVGVDGVSISAHRFLLADRSALIADWLVSEHCPDSQDSANRFFRLVESSPDLAVISSDVLTGAELFNLLTYLYSGKGGGGGGGGRLADACKALRLKSAKMQRFEADPPLAISRCSPGPAHFADLTIQSSVEPQLEPKRWLCHSALMAARSDYFDAMLMSSHGGWRETSSACLSLPYPASLLSRILDFIYTGSSSVCSPNSPDDPAPDLLDSADYLQLPGLRLASEAALAQRLHLRSFASLAVLADSRNADRLLAACRQFAANNLPALLELAGLCLARLPAGLLACLGRDLRCRLRPSGRRFQPIGNEDQRERLSRVIDRWLAGVVSDETPLPTPPTPSSAVVVADAVVVGKALTARQRRSRGSSLSTSQSECAPVAAVLVKSPELTPPGVAGSELLEEKDAEDELSAPPPRPCGASYAARLLLGAAKQQNTHAAAAVDREAQPAAGGRLAAFKRQSQRERKSQQLKQQQQSPPPKSPATATSSETHSIPIVSNEADPRPSLSDIMAEEMQSKSAPTAATLATPSSVSMPAFKRQSQRQRKSSSTAAATASSPPTPSRPSPSQTVGNPWKPLPPPSLISTSPPSTSVPVVDYPDSEAPTDLTLASPNFKVIVASAEAEQAVLRRRLSKPLHLIQIEEAAINELKQLYLSDDSGRYECRITVDYCSEACAQPLWPIVQKKKTVE